METKQQLKDALDQARQNYKKAQDEVSKAYEAYSSFLKAEEAKIPMTIERAMVTYLEDHVENTDGHDFLEDLIHCQNGGAIYKSGISNSGIWSNNNQYRIQLRISADASDDDLGVTVKNLQPFVDAMLVGALDTSDSYWFKDHSDYLKNSIAIGILDDACGEMNSWILCRDADGEWFVFDQHSYVFEKKVSGTLIECLKGLRLFAPYS